MVEYYEARALFDYTPATADELRLRAGEPVEVRIDRSRADDDVGEEGWLSGSDLLGNHGLFPANYVVDTRTPPNPSNTSAADHGEHADHDDRGVASNNRKPIVVGREKGIGGAGGGGQPGQQQHRQQQQQQYGRNGNDAHTTQPPLKRVLPTHGNNSNAVPSGRADYSTGTAPPGGSATAATPAYYEPADRAQQGGRQNGGAPTAGAGGSLPPGKFTTDHNVSYGNRNTAAATAAAAAHVVAPSTTLPGSSSHDDGGASHPLQDGWFSRTDEATGMEYYYTADGQSSWVRPIAAVLGEPLPAENASIQAMRIDPRVGGGGGGGGASSIDNAKYVSPYVRIIYFCDIHLKKTNKAVKSSNSSKLIRSLQAWYVIQ